MYDKIFSQLQTATQYNSETLKLLQTEEFQLSPKQHDIVQTIKTEIQKHIARVQDLALKLKQIHTVQEKVAQEDRQNITHSTQLSSSQDRQRKQNLDGSFLQKIFHHSEKTSDLIKKLAEYILTVEIDDFQDFTKEIAYLSRFICAQSFKRKEMMLLSSVRKAIEKRKLDLKITAVHVNDRFDSALMIDTSGKFRGIYVEKPLCFLLQNLQQNKVYQRAEVVACDSHVEFEYV
ncbi:MAG: hypothetical protein ACMXYA_02460 [Candidatus Woesearchaeota archaeon]